MTFTQRKELAEQVDNWIKDNDVQCCTFAVITYLDMKKMIETPELIRCEECLWRVGSDCARFTDLPVFMYDYCSRAKRR